VNRTLRSLVVLVSALYMAGEETLVPWTTLLGYDVFTSRYRVLWWHIEPDGKGGQHATDGGNILVAR
jgi:hypothetical protein